MSALVPDTSEGGNTRRLMEDLASDDGAPPEPTQRSATPELPARFKGKNAGELVEMYTNLESHSGRLANSLGQTQQQLTEALALAKRSNDLRENDHVSPASAEVNSMDLLTNPTKALEGFLNDKIAAATSGLRTTITSLEGKLNESRFNTNHKDAQQCFQDPGWSNFVGATPLRSTLANRAAQGDYQAADTLLTEWKASRIVADRDETSAKGRKAAGRVNLESSSSGGDDGASRPTGKVYRRADIMQLMQRDPDTYYSDSVQNTLMKARLEGRIVD